MYQAHRSRRTHVRTRGRVHAGARRTRPQDEGEYRRHIEQRPTQLEGDERVGIGEQVRVMRVVQALVQVGIAAHSALE